MSKNSQFQKFINQKSNAARKEGFKQEKKAAKKERAAAIEQRFEEKRRLKSEAYQKAAEREALSRQSAQAAREARAALGKGARGTVRSTEKPVRPAAASAGDRGSRAGIVKRTDTRPTAPSGHRGKPVGSRATGPGSPQAGVHAAPAAGQKTKPAVVVNKSGTPALPLNKYIAHSGLCSRRDAADLVRQGEVTVNGTAVTEPGTKIFENDVVKYRGKVLKPSKNFVYILLNKPKDYITTSDDPEGRKTVLDLIKHATPERVYPVGRLDRNTSGVLLLTNDGDLAQTLSHPKHEIKKIYEVKLDKPLTKTDFDKLLAGITLEDGYISPDVLGHPDPKDKTIVGIEIHSGRNRIVRRIFESLGYDVRQLDRVMYAGLTKKNVTRGKWRFLSEKEVRILRHFNPQTKKSAAPKQRK